MQQINVTIDATAIPEKITGVGRYVYNLAAAFGRRADIDVTLITKAGDRERWLVANPGMEIRDIAPANRLQRIVWEQTSLPRELSRLSPDLHHGTHYTMPRMTRLPRAVTVHDLTLMDHPEWHERSKVIFFRNAIRAAIRSAAVIICDSQATADRLMEFGRPKGHVRVASLGVDLLRFNPGEPGPRHGSHTELDVAHSDIAALSRLGVESPYLAFIGTIEPRKGVPDLVEGFNRVASKHSDLSLVIAGVPGWGEEAAARAIAASPYRDRIVRLGFIDDSDIPAVIRQAAAVVYPSLEEGFGLPVLEALACGAPTVTTSGSAMEEYAKGAAVLIDPGDVAALADAIDLILRGDPDLEQRRARGFEAAQARSWDTCADEHVSAYRLAASLA